MNRNGVRSVIFLNSLFNFLCAYLILFFISRISIAVSASAFSIPVRLYYYEVDYLIRSSDWSADAVTVVFGTGPLLCFILGIVLMIVYFKVAAEEGMLRILLVWLFVLSFISFLGEVIIGALMNLGFGYVIMYMFIMDTGRIVVTLLGGIILVLAGVALSRILLFIANIYYTDLKDVEIPRFVMYQYFFPYLAGLVLLQLIEIPQLNWFGTLTRLCGLLFFIPVLSRSLSLQDIYFEEERPEFRISWLTGFAAVLMILIYRIAFGIGIRFAL